MDDFHFVYLIHNVSLIATLVHLSNSRTHPCFPTFSVHTAIRLFVFFPTRDIATGTQRTCQEPWVSYIYMHIYYIYENSGENGSCYPNRTTTTLKYPTSQLDALRVLKTVVEFATIEAEPLYISYNFMYNHHHDYFACVVRIVMHVLLSLVSKVVDRWVNSL